MLLGKHQRKSQFRFLECSEIGLVAGGDAPSDPRFDEFGNLKPGYFITDDGQIMSSDPLDPYGTGAFGGDGGGDGDGTIVVTGNVDSDSSSGSSTSGTPEPNGHDIFDPTSDLNYILEQMGLLGDPINTTIIVTGTIEGGGDGGTTHGSQFQYHEPGHEQEISEFQQNQNEIANQIDGAAEFEVANVIVVNGERYEISFSSSSLAQELRDFDFYFNSSQTDAFGIGGAFEGFAVVDPDVLSDPTPMIIVQGEAPRENANWNWFALHEFAHDLLTDVYDALFQAWLEQREEGEIFENSSFFDLNEALADALVFAIAERIGLDVESNIPEDRRFTENPFTVNDGSSGGDDNGGTEPLPGQNGTGDPNVHQY